MRFQFIGDPKENGSGPKILEWYGHRFELNGAPVDVCPDDATEKGKQAATLLTILKRHNHFRAITPEVLKKDAEELAAKAKVAAEQAARAAREASIEAEPLGEPDAPNQSAGHNESPADVGNTRRRGNRVVG